MEVNFEFLDLDSIENLFANDEEETVDTPNEEIADTPEEEDNTTTEVNPDELFGGPESVGSGTEDTREGKNAPQETGTSPHFYSSIAQALATEGIFPDLNDEELANIKTPEDFKELIEKRIDSGISQRQKDFETALNGGVPVSELSLAENAIQILNGISEEDLTDESDRGVDTRKRLLMLEYGSKGFSKERAQRAIERAFNDGTDVDEAREALASQKAYYQDKYKNLLDVAKKNKEAKDQEFKLKIQTMTKDIVDDPKAFGDLELDKSTRKKILSNLTSIAYTDHETNTKYNAIQRYQLEHPTEFMKYVAMAYTLTNGFSDMSGLFKGQVKKERKKDLRNLERLLTNSPNPDGSISFVGINDANSKVSNWDLDI